MKTICVPVAPISRAILLSNFHEEPICPPRKNMILSHLRHTDPNKSRKLNRIQSVLTSEIIVRVSNKLSDHLVKYGYQVGYYLYKVHLERMCQFTHAQYLNGKPARKSIRDFLRMHKISEDDFSLESAYKRWQRWNISRNNQKKNQRKEEPDSEILEVHKPLPEDCMKIRLAKFVRRNFHSFLLADGTLSDNMVTKARIYIRYDLMKMDVRDICNKEELSPATVYHHIHTFKQKLKLGELNAY